MANVLLVGDNPNWAFGQTIASMQHHYQGSHELRAAWTTNMEDLSARHQHAGLIVAFCVPIVGRLMSLGVPMDKVIVGIRGTGEESMPSARVVKRLESTQGVICANVMLFNVWRGNHEHVYLAYEAADLREWFPKTLREEIRRQIVVGWNGNSFKRYKNYHEIFVPVMDRLEKEKIATRIVRDRDVNGIPRNRMRDEFYHQIDLLAMTAFREGNPYPLYEAMACGVPCVSADAGVAPELISHGKDGWIITNPTVDTFCSRIHQIANDPRLLKRAGSAARKKIEARWSWNVRITEWAAIFDEALARRGIA